MNLEQFVLQSKGKSFTQLIPDDSFKRFIFPHAALATARASELVLNSRYVDSRNSEFIHIHNESWAKIMANLANWQESSASLILPRNERVLVAGWHFPEIPAVFALAKTIHTLMLVSQDAPWLEPLRVAGCTLNLFASGSTMQLAREMKSGRVIAAMLDHSYPDTRCETAKLFGRNVNTPSGVLELCSRFGYLMVFVAPRSNGVEVVAQIDTTGRTASELAQQFNTWLEAEVNKSPATWLMWQSLPPR